MVRMPPTKANITLVIRRVLKRSTTKPFLEASATAVAIAPTNGKGVKIEHGEFGATINGCKDFKE